MLVIQDLWSLNQAPALVQILLNPSQNYIPQHFTGRSGLWLPLVLGSGVACVPEALVVILPN